MKKRGTAALVVRVKKADIYLYIAKGPLYDALISGLVNPVVAVCNKTIWKQRIVRNMEIVFDRVVVIVIIIINIPLLAIDLYQIKKLYFEGMLPHLQKE